MSRLSVLVLHEEDNVGVAVEAIQQGATLPNGIVARNSIEAGHKVAIQPIAAGDRVRKYGEIIGRATTSIARGEHVHTHNMETTLKGIEDYQYQPLLTKTPIIKSSSQTFLGYRRSDGRVGTRNEIWIVCTVGCVAQTAQKIAELAAQKYENLVDGVFAITHPLGCSQVGADLSTTRHILAGLARHPNAGGVLIVGLGCENNQLADMEMELHDGNTARLKTITAQEEDDEIEAGLSKVAELLEIAKHDQREPCPVAELVLGVKCGGSDAFSGLTANPLVGRISDQVYAAGGSVILSEIPEVFGSERLLMQRARDEVIFNGIVSLVNDFKTYFLKHGETISDNPSPGNIAGGITTLEEKSLGAIQKSGQGEIVEVLRYGQQVTHKGVVLLEAPGNDAVSSTALVAAGANIILFTTGRGTPLGFPAPTLKIASNSKMASRKSRWIDFDAGQLMKNTSFETAAQELMRLVLKTASGNPTKAEKNGEREIAIWKRGVTL